MILQAKKEELLASKTQLKKEVIDKVTQLENSLKASELDKSRYEQDANELQAKLNHAALLVDGLKSERSRWETSIANLIYN